MKVMKHKALRRRIVAILATLNEPITAATLVERLIESGLSQNYIGNTNRVAQVCCRTKGIGSTPIITTGHQGESYALDGYVLESEEAFIEWMASKG